MKLLQRTGFYFMGFSLLILIIGGISIFYALSYMLDHEMDESLKHTRSVLYKELSKKEDLPSTLEIMDEVIDIKEIPPDVHIEVYKDTLRPVDENGKIEMEPYRQYIYSEKIHGKNYRIALNHSKFGRENLLITISGLIIGSLFFFFILLNLFNRFLSQRLWQPFYYTINQIRHFGLNQPHKIASLPTTIEEFQTLDHALAQMTEKLLKDYRSLKQFTENASHEIQTPLAIIRSQVELLLQQEKQEEKSLHHLQQIQHSASKLSKINQSLLLLTRIENRQFEKLEKIVLGEVILKKLDALELLISEKSIEVQKDIEAALITANPYLLDVIISNLLSNAIKHNLPKGKISIQLNPNQLCIGNSGTPLTQAPTQLFERFRKADDASKSVGLGLAIVKEICEIYGWKIEYKNEGEWHEMIINFI